MLHWKKNLSIQSFAMIALVAGPGSQMDAEAQGDQAIEEIVVTGSYIRRDGFESASPLDIVDQADLAAAAAPTMGDIVQHLTMNTGSQVQSDFSDTGDFATTRFNLRGLGFGSTLTLVNGRRVTQNSGGGSFVDVNQFPVSMIERIEILKDGAAAIYGSDAIAGVVNLVTRQVEGFEVEVGYQTTTDMKSTAGESDDTQDLVFNGAFGVGNDRGRIDVFVSHLHRTKVNDNEQFNGNITSFGYPGAFRLLETPVAGPYAGVPAGAVIQDPDCGALGGLNPSPNGGGLCRINLAPTSFDFIPQEERSAIFTRASYGLTDRVHAFSEFSYSHYDVDALQNETNAMSRQTVTVPADHPDNIFGVPAHFLGRPTVAGRTVGYLNDNLRGMAGLSYEFDNGWYAEAAYVYSRNQIDRTSIRTFVADVQAALNGVGGPGGTYRLNPFGSAVTGAGSPNERALIDYLSVEIPAWRMSSLQTVDFHATGPLFDLPAGALSVAFGGQYRTEGMEQLNDSSRLRDIDGQYAPALNFPYTTTDVWAGFLEVSVPVSETLELSAAVRHEDFGLGVGGTTDPKVTLRWQSPLDALAIRGSYSTSFRGPSILETSTPLRSTSALIVDPFSGTPGQCNGNQTVVIRENYSGNPNLQPESSENLNFGIMVNPTEALRASVDYWRYEYTDIIGQIGAQGIVDADCRDDGIRNDPRITMDPTGTILQDVQTSFFNRSLVKTDGIDIAATYDFDAWSNSNFNLGANASYILSLEAQSDQFSPVVDGTGSRNRNNSLPPAPELRSNVFLGWASNRHTANLIMRYVDAVSNDRNPDDPIGSMTTFDTQYSYSINSFYGMDVSLTFGLKNIFDKKAPHLMDEFTGFLSNMHDPRGRIVYARIKSEF